MGQQKSQVANPFNEVFGNIAAGIAAVYVLAVLCIFPFYTTNYYFDILKDRFDIFWRGTLLTGVLFVLLFLVYAAMDFKENAGMNVKEALSAFRPRELRSHVTATDVCFLALLLIMLLSMALSGFPYETFWGSLGRYQGVLCWLMYGTAYLIITRFYRFREWHLRAFQLAGLLVCLWGITDFFKLNLMHFLDQVPEGQANIFVSSVGNINSYTNLTAVIFAFAAVMFIADKKPLPLAWDFIAMLTGAFACVMGVSDNVVFAFAALFGLLPFWAFRTKRGVFRYFAALATALTAIAVTGMLVNTGLDNIAIHIGGSFFISLGQSGAALPAAGLLWLASAVIYLFYLGQAVQHGEKSRALGGHFAQHREVMAATLDAPTAKWVRTAWAVFFAAALLAVIAVVADANSGRHAELWQPYANALIFDDDWGTHRGHNWRLAWEYFTQDAGWLTRLFGRGPDTYYMITMDNYYNEMISKYGEVYDSAHNEYLNYLLTVGILGLLAYLGMMLSGIRAVLTKAKDSPVAVAAAFAAIAYMGQAFINIAVPITLPTMFALVFIGFGIAFRARR